MGQVIDNGTPDHTDTIKGMDTATKSDAFGITSYLSTWHARLGPILCGAPNGHMTQDTIKRYET